MTKVKFPRLSENERRRLLAPPSGSVRLVVDTDAHNEIDDQFAIAWALLSQDVFHIEAMYAAPYSFALHRDPMLKVYELMKAGKQDQVTGDLTRYVGWVQNFLSAAIDPYQLPFVGPEEGMELSYQEILTVYGKLGQESRDKVYRGSTGFLTAIDNPIDSPAAQHLIDRALADDENPLYVAAIGSLPNIASAILLEPAIIRNMVVIWTAAYPSTFNRSNSASFNLVQDLLSAQVLFDCGVPLVYLPGFHVGAQLGISLPEVERWVKGRGAIGDYLYHLYLNNPIRAQSGISDHFGRSWIIWDLINFAWLLDPSWVPSQLLPSPILTDNLIWAHAPGRHQIREAYGVNRDAIYRDFFTKLDLASA